MSELDMYRKDIDVTLSISGGTITCRTQFEDAVFDALYAVPPEHRVSVKFYCTPLMWHRLVECGCIFRGAYAGDVDRLLGVDVMIDVTQSNNLSMTSTWDGKTL